ncbi:MAG: acetyl-CoA carboxylase carboxyl transferase subunit alpha [Armatimonadota bacterium]|nr:acetyl-CoA carboxylase carboxyl transferase subunit alpha [Armatimonadota bacterium]MDW8156106.1 acetyl-CoA carboxylase carboxyl transferase subunit alpha [Armatimonadota bacterium]
MAEARSQAQVSCPRCGTAADEGLLASTWYTCPSCQYHLPVPAPVRIAQLADAGSFREWDRGLTSVDPLHFADHKPYRERLWEARRATGLREAVVTGQATLDGQPFVLVVFDFRFLGGTMGSAVGEKVARAFEGATRRRLPVLAVTASGGARMQEGMLSLLQMAKTAAAAGQHHAAGLPYVAVLSNPTFGGVAASFGVRADVLLAEPDALIGFVGPRVVEMTTGEPAPEEAYRAESLLRHGLVDMVVPRGQQRRVLSYLLRHLRPAPSGRVGRPQLPPLPQPAHLSAWETVQLARRVGRPTAVDYLLRAFDGFLELHGDRASGDDPAVVAGLGELGGQTVFVVAQERGRTEEEQVQRRRGMALPEGFRKACRILRMASKFQLPLVTLVDTPGAYPGPEAERRGIAAAIAECLATLVALPVPTVAVVIGEGGSGGALALATADRVLMLEHAIYSVISPEGAAAILYRNASRAPEVAEALRLTSADLRRLGVVDRVVPEPPGGAHNDPQRAAELLRDHLLDALRDVQAQPIRRLVRQRYQRYRHIGPVGTYWKVLLREELEEFREGVVRRLRRPAAKAAEPS